MKLIKKLYLKTFDKEKYQYYKNKDKIEKNINKYKEEFEDKLNEIQNSLINKKSLNFLHSGHCGDIISCLPVIKELSKKHDCNFYIELDKKMDTPYHNYPTNNVFLDKRIFNLLEPLLKKQSYIKSINPYKGEKIDVDLNLFRNMPINISFNSPRWFFHITGVHADLTQPYLNVDEHDSIRNKIIMHRTFRYRNNFINFDFMNRYDDVYFIGLKDEYLDLKKQIKKLKLYDCKDFLDMASIIKSSKYFIGNSSIAFPIAEALKVPRILEASPEFPIIQPSGKDGYDFYYQPHFEKWVDYLEKKYSTNK